MLKITVALILTIIGLYFFTLFSIPIFLDEATYLSFAQSINDNPRQLFISFPAGVMPILPWMLSLLFHLPETSPEVFYLGRIILTIFNLGSALFIYLIALKFSHRKVGLLGALIYLSLPLTIFHGRLIMLEPLMIFFLLGGLYCWISWLLKETIKSKRDIWKGWQLLLLAGVGFSLAYLTKPLALSSILAFLAAPLLLYGNKVSKKALAFGAIFLGVLILAVTFPFSQMVVPYLKDYHVQSSSPSDLWPNFKLNLWRSFWWMSAYLSIPILLFSFLAGILYTVIKKNIFVAWVLIWTLSIILINSITATNYFPRHIYPLAPPIALLTAYILYKLSLFSKSLAVICGLALLLPLWFTNGQILFNPETAPLAAEDRQQFFTEWSAGTGIFPVGHELEKNVQSKDDVIYIEPVNYLLSFALPFYFPQLKSFIQPLPKNITHLAKGNVFLVLDRSDYPPTNAFQPIFTYSKGGYHTVRIYQLQSLE